MLQFQGLEKMTDFPSQIIALAIDNRNVGSGHILDGLKGSGCSCKQPNDGHFNISIWSLKIVSLEEQHRYFKS